MLITVTSQQALINNAFSWTRALTVSAFGNVGKAVVQKKKKTTKKPLQYLQAVTSLTPVVAVL